jgi:CRP/FNR family cyclic AMP-dependent transcriptional regulator
MVDELVGGGLAALRDTVPGLHPEDIHSRFSSYFAYPGTEAARDDFVFLPDRSKEDWERLVDHSEVLLFRTGDLVIRAGEKDRALYIVVEGTLEILLHDERGAEHRYGVIDPRSVTGEMAFLDGRPRAATIRALTDGELLRISFESYEALAARYPELGRAILLDLGRILAARLRQANEVIARVSD